MGDGLAPGQDHQIYIILNPIAGHSYAEEIHSAFEESFSENGWTYEVYETTGKEDVSGVARKACERGVDLVIAAGGDGTVAEVVNGLIDTDVPLGILPVGTGNGLARSLQIPISIDEAMQLIAGEHRLQPVDAMRVGERVFVLNVSVGVSPRAMQNTPPEVKRRFGMLGYAWVILKEFFTHKPPRYNLVIDGHNIQVQATEILISNGSILKEPPVLLGPPEDMNDSEFEVHILTARTIFDYLRLAWSLLVHRERRKQDLRTLKVQKSILIEHTGRKQPVQADGEVIGWTPVEVQIVANALKVIAPVITDEESNQK
jgi:YegS/Rv2252/BmrU family lipid kinase